MPGTGSCSIVNMEYVARINTLLSYNDSEFETFLSDMDNSSNSTNAGTYRNMLKQLLEEKSPGSEIGGCIASNILWRYVPPIIFLFGTIGNILTFIILCQRAMNKVSFYVYLATLAVVDEIILFCGLFRHWLDQLIGKRIEDMSPAVCKLSQLIGTTTSFLSVWLIVTMTIERLVVITLPLRASQIATPRRAKILTAVLALVCFLLSAHFIFTVDIIGDNSGVCDFKANFSVFNRVWAWVDASLYSYLPFLVISSINISMRIKIRQANKHRSEMLRNGMRRSSPWTMTVTQNTRLSKIPPPRGDSTRQLTMMLLTVSCAFLVTTTPIVIIKFLSLTMTFTGSVRETANFQLADTLSEFLMHVNHSMNFYLYCATGQKFRQQLCYLFNFPCINRERNSLNNTMNNGISTHGMASHLTGNKKTNRLDHCRPSEGRTTHNDEICYIPVGGHNATTCV